MKLAYWVFGICVATVLTGCANFGETKVSMPYITEVDRKDQMVAGNRGYIKGTPPAAEDKTGRKRTFITVDVDLPKSSKEAGIQETHFAGTKTTEGASQAQASQQESVK